MTIGWMTAGFCLFGSLLFLSFIFIVAHLKRRYDLIDVAWGLVFIAIAVISYTAHAQELYSVQTLVTLLVAIWGLRLSFHIYSRWDKSSVEDKRYAALRKKYAKKWGGVGFNIYLRVFVVQAILAVVVSLPIVVVNSYDTIAPTILAAVGLAVWAVGFYFESVGDYQLQKHIRRSENKGKILTSGLWKYTRHPNYFGEIVQWWGIFIIAAVTPLWWVAIIGPVVITILVVFISGVPLTETHFEGRPGWNTYKKHTSKLFPLPPR